MRKITKKLTLLFILALLLYSQSSHLNPVFAQELTLSISPPIVEALIKPGKSIVIAYTISNFGDPVLLKADVMPFSAKGNLGEVNIDEEFSGPIRFNLENSNIQLKKPFALSQQEGQQLVLKIRVPEGTPEGDYYYTFFVETDPDNTSDGIQIAQATAQIGSHILISVSRTGAVERRGSIGNFDISPHYQIKLFGKKYYIFESTDIVPVRLLINNVGGNLIKPEGTIKLAGGFNEKREYHLLPENILSQSSRLIHATPSANITRQSRDSLVLKGFFIGKYILDTSVSFGLGTENRSARISFYAFPFKFILALMTAGIIAIVIIKKLRKDETSQETPQLNDDL